MLAQDPETQALQPTTSTARHARDKRRPYASLHGASPHENLNCRYAFDRTDSIAPEHQGIVCCYLALMYCERLLKNPDFHPSEFFDTVDPRQEDASRLLHLLSNLSHYSETWHLLPSCRFSDFLRQAFTDLIERKERPWAVYKVFTLTHSLGLRLRVKSRTDAAQELVVQVYDPNQTRVHTMARVAGPQDWGSEGQAHDLLSFLCAHSDTPPARADVLASYFTAHDPDAHIALFELRADAEGNLVQHDAPAPLATNWCTSPRIQLHYAHQNGDCALLDASIAWFFDDLEAKQLSDPGLLLDVPQVDRSVLRYILMGANGVGQAQWQARWEQTQDMAMKVQLLRGHNKAGEHLLMAAELWNPQGLCWWLGLVATLPVDHLLAALKIDDELGYFDMEQWVMNGHAIAGSAWPSILRTVRAHRPADVRKLMASVATDGVPMLAQYTNDDRLDSLQEWGSLLPEVSQDDLVYLLLAQDGEGISALHRAMATQQPGWIELWGRWWASAPAASQARLLWGLGPNGEPALWTLARSHHPATLEAWLKLWRQLPADQRAEPLAANREEAPYVSVLHRAMTGAGANPDDPEAGSAAFIEQWGACLEAVPAAHRAALLQGTPNPRNTALRRALETGHWAAVVAWAGLLRWVTPSERDALTPLTEGPDQQLTQAVRRHAQQDPAAYQAALEALREPLPANAWAWMQAQAPAPRADRANTDD
jgi:hypothetical protein